MALSSDWLGSGWEASMKFFPFAPENDQEGSYRQAEIDLGAPNGIGSSLGDEQTSVIAVPDIEVLTVTLQDGFLRTVCYEISIRYEIPGRRAP
jgi:hypothetical protein